MKKILLLTDFSSGYSRSLLRGIVQYSKEHGPWVFYRMPLYYRELHGDDGVVQWAKKWEADAVIAQLENVNINKLNKLKIPIIIQNYKERANKICNITGDYFHTGEIAADFFINKGFSNFAYYGMQDMIWSRERSDGFRNRIEAKGYSLSTLNNNSREKERWLFDSATMSDWLLSLPKPVALFACDDYYAAQITETCRICNISVPEEIAVLGVDNDELICNISDPPLSSIVLDVENGGYRAAQRLHRLFQEEIFETNDIIINPLRIVSRQSTDYIAVENGHIFKIVKYIEANYHQTLSIEDLLRLVPLSRRALEKSFKKELKSSIYQYLLRYRIERFAELLLTTDKALFELASQCGFEDYKNVSRVFFRYKKMTPLQYKKHNLNQTIT